MYSIPFLTPGIPLEDSGSWFSGLQSKDWFFEREKEIQWHHQTLLPLLQAGSFWNGSVFSDSFIPQHRRRHQTSGAFSCLRVRAGSSKSKQRSKQSPVVSVYLSRWSQSKNDSEPGGGWELESMTGRGSFSFLIDATWLRVTKLEVLSVQSVSDAF